MSCADRFVSCDCHSDSSLTQADEPSVIDPHALVVWIRIHCISHEFEFYAGSSCIDVRETLSWISDKPPPCSFDSTGSSWPLSQSEMNTLER